MTADMHAATNGFVVDDPLSRIADAIRDTLPGEAGEALLARVAEIIAEPLSEELEVLALENARLQEELAQTAASDPLTGLRNRRRFFEDLRREFASARRYGTPLAIVALEVGDLEEITAAKGLAAGDELMRTLAETLLTQLRVTDISARIGDAGFAVILPQTPVEGGRRVAERLATALEGSVSAGSASLDTEITSAAELLERAVRDLDASR